MRIVIGWIIVAVLVCALVYIVVGNIYRDAALKRAIRCSKKWERDREGTPNQSSHDQK